MTAMRYQPIFAYTFSMTLYECVLLQSAYSSAGGCWGEIGRELVFLYIMFIPILSLLVYHVCFHIFLYFHFLTS